MVGRDFVGEVELAGPGSRLQRGARVWGVVPPHRPGSHAEYVLVRDSWVSDGASRQLVLFTWKLIRGHLSINL